MATIGLLEGVAEGTAAITKVFSGAISDYQTFQPIPSCHSEGYTLPGPPLDFRLATGD
jgi:hypothetical protein